jgi:hypothetical protein
VGGSCLSTPMRKMVNFDNGVLTVTIPMREEAKPHKVAVSSGTSGEIGAGSSN